MWTTQKYQPDVKVTDLNIALQAENCVEAAITAVSLLLFHDRYHFYTLS